MDQRLLKQISIAFIFFGLVGSFVYFGFFFGEEDRPQATPLVINPPQIVFQNLLRVSDLDYDFLAELRNPNADFGAASLVYELELFDQAGDLVASRRNSTFLRPGQTKYEIISPIKTSRPAAGFNFRIVNAEWQRLEEFVSSDLFSVKNQTYSEIEPSETGFSKVGGAVSNDSNFDFDKVDVYVVLFGEGNNPIAVNKTDIRTFLSRTDRFFEVKWAEPFSGEVSRVEVNAYTDVFKNENFIKEYGTQEKFQRFY